MIGDSGTGKNGKLHTYYACTAHKHKHGCTKKNIRQAKLEEMVYDATANMVLCSSITRAIAKQVEAIRGGRYSHAEEMQAVQAHLKGHRKAESTTFWQPWRKDQFFQSCLFSPYNTGNRTITPRKTAEKPAPCKAKHHSKPC